MSIPLVSVITVCRNAEHTIRRTIESVLSQSYKNIEYIIIDGCSEDNTSNIVKEFNTGISLFLREKDQGISDAFNKGIRLAKGEFIQILNADDYFPADKIEKSVELLVTHPIHSYCFGDIVLIDDHQNPTFRIEGDPQYYRMIRYFMPRINHPTVLSRKSTYEKYGMFDTQWKNSMDYDWLLRLHINSEKGIYSPKIVAFMQEGGQSGRNWIKTQIDELHVSMHNGLNPLVAYAIFYMRFLRTFIRIQVEYFLPRQWLMPFRPGKKLL
ncbi:MAG: glycosyltransferase family 2 protein [bacterium]|nr:glycosyltransferase family 2 protein [bacterium]